MVTATFILTVSSKYQASTRVTTVIGLELKQSCDTATPRKNKKEKRLASPQAPYT